MWQPVPACQTAFGRRRGLGPTGRRRGGARGGGGSQVGAGNCWPCAKRELCLTAVKCCVFTVARGLGSLEAACPANSVVFYNGLLTSLTSPPNHAAGPDQTICLTTHMAASAVPSSECPRCSLFPGGEAAALPALELTVASPPRRKAIIAGGRPWCSRPRPERMPRSAWAARARRRAAARPSRTPHPPLAARETRSSAQRNPALLGVIQSTSCSCSKLRDFTAGKVTGSSATSFMFWQCNRICTAPRAGYVQTTLVTQGCTQVERQTLEGGRESGRLYTARRRTEPSSVCSQYLTMYPMLSLSQTVAGQMRCAAPAPGYCFSTCTVQSPSVDV